MEKLSSILKREFIPNRRTSPCDGNLDIEPYICEYCHDAQSLHPLNEKGAPDYSASIPCRHCVSPEYIRKYLGVSSLDNTFENFKPVQGTEKVLDAAKRISELNTTWKLLMIYGTWGNGKTHLIDAIALELWVKGIAAKVYEFPDFIGRLKNTFDRSQDNKGDRFEEIIERYCTMPYLLLDDVGSAGSFTEWSKQQLERIILARYRDRLLTVMTTNVDKKELPEFVMSRFGDSEISRMVLNKAVDYRPRKLE